MTDPFNIPAANLDGAIHLALSTAFEPDLFLDGERFLSHLFKYAVIDCMTYSRSKSIVSAGPPIQRLIYGVKQRGCNIKAKETKFMLNNHVKLFICYTNFTTDVFVGSQNLTRGYNLNFMYRVRPEHVQPLIDTFEQIWRKL